MSFLSAFRAAKCSTVKSVFLFSEGREPVRVFFTNRIVTFFAKAVKVFRGCCPHVVHMFTKLKCGGIFSKTFFRASDALHFWVVPFGS